MQAEYQTSKHQEKYTSIFAGFFPVENPQYVMVIVYDEAEYEHYSYYAAQSAVPTFREIVKKIVNLPDSDIIAKVKEDEKKFIFAPDVTGIPLENAKKILNKAGINFVVCGENQLNQVIDQYPKPNTSFDSKENIILNLASSQENTEIDLDSSVMPNLIGMSLRKAISTSKRNNIKLVIRGNGIISNQSIVANSRINFGDICTITAK